MTIVPLSVCEYRGKSYTFSYETPGYYDIVREDGAFRFVYTETAPQKRGFTDTLCSPWLEEPVLYGAMEGECLAGFIEGSRESWNKRFRISNLLVFEGSRRRGVGSALMERMLAHARDSGARMAVLETQSCNLPAIRFYRKHGFKCIGFDLYAYSNRDPEVHEVRLEMGLAL